MADLGPPGGEPARAREDDVPPPPEDCLADEPGAEAGPDGDEGESEDGSEVGEEGRGLDWGFLVSHPAEKEEIDGQKEIRKRSIECILCLSQCHFQEHHLREGR